MSSQVMSPQWTTLTSSGGIHAWTARMRAQPHTQLIVKNTGWWSNTWSPPLNLPESLPEPSESLRSIQGFAEGQFRVHSG